MGFDRRASHRGTSIADQMEVVAKTPGKQTFSSQLSEPVQASSARSAGPGHARRDLAALRAVDAGTERPTLASLFPGVTSTPAVQRRAEREPGGARDESAIHASAARGIATPSSALPFADVIQRSFGRHDISSIQAHVGADAAASAGAIGADAYASGNHVVLGRGTDLFTVAHEAAHIVQQRGGVHLKGGVGAAGDAYEQHADAVAALVVQNKSSEALLDRYADAGASGHRASADVQCMPTKWVDIDTNAAHPWMPHRTALDHQGHSKGSGARLNGAPVSKISYGGVGQAGGLGVTATNLGKLPQAPAITADVVGPMRQAQPGIGVYHNVALLPAILGGESSFANVVALPPAAALSLQYLHGVANRLIHQAGTYLNYAVTVQEQLDQHAGVYYARSIHARWAQVTPHGGEVAGSVGDYTITVMPPSYSKGQDTSKADAADLGPLTVNQATSPTPHDRMRGARATELRTTIDFAPALQGDGVRMTAYRLGPDHKIGDQPTTGNNTWTTRRRALETASGNKMSYVAGHLLNHHLGGPGNEERNLTPIPSDVNDLHESAVESVIKKLVNIHGRWVYYDVQVKHLMDGLVPYPAELVCTWAQLDQAGDYIPSTYAQKTLPIRPPSAYGVAPIAYGKKLPNLATLGAVHQAAGANTLAADGAETTLDFDDVLLEDSATLKHQAVVMQPLIAHLKQVGLHTQFMHNAPLRQGVLAALAAVKPSAIEAAARAAVDQLIPQLKALQPDALDGARALIDALQAELDVFEREVRGRALRTDDATVALFSTFFAEPRATQFASHLGQARLQALQDLILTKQSATAVIDVARRLLDERERHLASLAEISAPWSPNQEMGMDEDEATHNAEAEPPTQGGMEAHARRAKRRAKGTNQFTAQAPARRDGANALLVTIDQLVTSNRKWPMSEGSTLSPPAMTIGKAIESLVLAGASASGALAMVVQALYATQTRAFNEYAAWLAERHAEGPTLSFDDLTSILLADDDNSAWLSDSGLDWLS